VRLAVLRGLPLKLSLPLPLPPPPPPPLLLLVSWLMTATALPVSALLSLPTLLLLLLLLPPPPLLLRSLGCALASPACGVSVASGIQSDRCGPTGWLQQQTLAMSAPRHHAASMTKCCIRCADAYITTTDAATPKTRSVEGFSHACAAKTRGPVRGGGSGSAADEDTVHADVCEC